MPNARSEINMKRNKLILIPCILSLFISFRAISQQITYNDSCLEVLFYSINSNKYETELEIKLKEYDYFSDDSTLNLRVVFRNKCNSMIIVPSDVMIQFDFNLEGEKELNHHWETMKYPIAWDYFGHHKRMPYPDRLLKAFSIFDIPFKYPLGFPIKEPGMYRFRLNFTNQYNYVPVSEYKDYKSNWIYIDFK
jgi:hypothetical protein